MPRIYKPASPNPRCVLCGAANIQGGDGRCKVCASDEDELTADEVDDLVREQEQTANWPVRWRDIPPPGTPDEEIQSPKPPRRTRGGRVLRKGLP